MLLHGLDPAVGALDVGDAKLVDMPLKRSATPALTRAQAFLNAEVLSRDLNRALDHLDQIGVDAPQIATGAGAKTKHRHRIRHSLRAPDHGGLVQILTRT